MVINSTIGRFAVAGTLLMLSINASLFLLLEEGRISAMLAPWRGSGDSDRCSEKNLTT